jgi:hypothetical protein
MKTYKLLLVYTVLIVSLLSCTRNVYVYKKVPPGQAKKATGHKSAKPYAPGQVKKKNSW